MLTGMSQHQEQTGRNIYFCAKTYNRGENEFIMSPQVSNS